MVSSGSERPIALIGPHPPYRGGIAHFTERVGSGLRAVGASVVPVSFKRMYPSVLFPGRSQFESVVPGTEPSLDWIDSLNPMSWTHAAREIARRDAAAAVFMYWMPFFSPAFTRIARRLASTGVPSLGIVHNAIPHERHFADAYLSARFFRACRSLIVLSRSVAADVGSLAPNVPARLVPHPVYDRFGDGIDPAVARERLQLSAESRVLLFFGNVRRYKGLDVLLEALPQAAAAVPDLVLLVAGEFYDDAGAHREMIRRLAIDDRVRIRDAYIPTEEVATYFSAADVLVHPYRSATQSGVVRTAQAFGVPVIATDVGALADDVGDGGIVVPPEDAGALAGAISAFFNEGRKRQLKENVLRLRSESSWTAFVNAVLDEFDPGGRSVG